MNYSKQIFKMLGIEPWEEFKIPGYNSDLSFCISETLLICCKCSPTDTWSCTNSLIPDLRSLLNGTKTIIKIPKPTPDEQLAIDYAKKCGYKWLAKNKDGYVYAYKNKPIKDTDCSYWEDTNAYNWDTDDEILGILIQIPISFIHWEDNEAYYIGD